MITDEKAFLIGSAEWFKEKSKASKYLPVQENLEKLRSDFLKRFSPEAIKEMDGEQLLLDVFSPEPTSMMQ